MHYYNVNLEPIDPMLFGDNRMAREGEDHILSSTMPSPYTIYGAVGNAIINILGVKKLSQKSWDPEIQHYLGEFIDSDKYTKENVFQIIGYTFKDSQDKIWYPAPKNLLIDKDSFYPLEIMTPGEFNIQSSCPFPMLLSKKSKDSIFEEDFFVDENSLKEILCGNKVGKISDLKIKLKDDFYLEEYRTGIGMDYHRNVVKKTILFSRPYWRFHTAISGNELNLKSNGFSVWCQTLKQIKSISTGEHNQINFFGGDRRRSIFFFKDIATKPFDDLLKEVLTSINDSKGLIVYLLTPLPMTTKKLNELSLNAQKFDAAAIGKSQYISGWLHKIKGQRPRKMLRLVPAGSVFFYLWKNETYEKKKNLIKNFWLNSLSPEYKVFGFGRILIGVWK